MFGLETLNVLIGLVTVYLAFGLACTAIVEAAATLFSLRSSKLEAALNEILAGELKKGKPFVDEFFAHPLVQSLSQGKKGRASYITPEIVVQVVEALLMKEGKYASLKEAIAALPDKTDTNRIKGLLDALATRTEGDTAKFRQAVETHFNAVMDRTSGWFKRHTQKLALVAAAVLVIGANVDTVDLAASLSSNATARAKMVEIAEQQWAAATAHEEGGTVEQVKKSADAAIKAVDRAVSTMEPTGLQLGWENYPKSFGGILSKITGLCVSIFAVSLGGPFWFGVLQRFMQVRAAGITPSKTQDEPEGKHGRITT
jgi:hypothetical protein